MSRATRSASRSPSPLRSQSRSRSRSRSTSQSRRSHSRSRSRRHRYSSRSRSRSRSRSQSPLYNRDKKYQNSREFRGYHRGFRRPYNFRGRGRGYFSRGRYQRGGGGGGGGRGYNNNNNFRNNWKNHKQNPHKQQQQNQSRGRPYIHKFSGSPPPPGHSRHSDRSLSPLSRKSQHSNASPRGSPPKAPLVANQSSNNVKEELLGSKEVQKEGTDGEETEVGDAHEAQNSGTTQEGWQVLMECNSSPKKASPENHAVTVQNSQNSNQPGTSPQTMKDTSNGASLWETMSNAPSTKTLSQEALNQMLSSLDVFKSEECLDGDKMAISIAFRKFWKEHNKKSKPTWENRRTEADPVKEDQVNINGPAPAAGTEVSSKLNGKVPLNHLLKDSPSLSDEMEEEMIPKPHSKSLKKERHNGDVENSHPKVVHPARELFEECYDRWQNVASAQDEPDALGEEMYSVDKSAAVARGQMVGTFEKLACKPRKMSESASILRRNSDREMFTLTAEDSSLLSLRKPETKINVRMDFLRDSLIGTSEILAQERQLSQDLVQSSKRGQEFRSIFQHVQAAPMQKTPSELFAQHIVAILHHIRAQHFASPRMTLNERFTVYQRQAAEKESMKLRKSPEIHRRIDVSPSAFKKHSQVFEAMKSSEDGTNKDVEVKTKSDPMDLRLDIERRKRYSSREIDYEHDGLRNSPDTRRESSEENFSKKSKSSSSSSSKSQMDDLPKPELKNDGFNRARLAPTETTAAKETAWRGFQVRFRGRGWKRGNYQADCNPDLPVAPTNQDCDQGSPPKNRKYYLHDDRDSEVEASNWTENQEGRGRGGGGFSRGRARFLIRKTNGGGPNITWAQDNFLVNGMREDQLEQDQKD
ncbi:thyroid hormone receptor-associated protein 3 isoform X2 [Syngnathoides biaculeatus]|uniref:thyroid hormone receptor-associated protein 3 isoform X2 n=1 Tax=Syngnathoides biaculeatus TaxID=300417 RepID=UPI002ADD5511|nr:thyroid hormone receptor-associated protein 3 isoform X2 [Syngnathoides biaculeatus]